MLGLDGSTREDFAAVRQFVEESGLYEVQIAVLSAMPGHTTLCAHARRGAPHRSDRLGAVHHLRCQCPAPEHVRRGAGGRPDQLGRELYGEEAKRRRKRAFAQQWREGRKSTLAKRDRREPDAIARN